MVCEDFVMLGKTVPEPCSDGRIFVCSAGVSKELDSLVRIYPLARRGAPGRWQRCRVQLERNRQDSRQESWKVAGDRSLEAHEAINQQFALCGEVPRNERATLLSRHVFPSIAAANERRASLAVIHPLGEPQFTLDHNPESPESPQLRLLDMGPSQVKGSKRFPYIPRLRFADEAGEHNLMLRDWGAYEFMRKHGTDGLKGALHLSEASSLFVGNLNNQRTAWCVISVLNGVREHPHLFDRRVAVAA